MFTYFFIRPSYLTITLAAAALAFAQDVRNVVSGQVRINGAGISEPVLHIDAVSGGTFSTSAFLHPDGSFEVFDVPSATYRVYLRDRSGDVIWNNMVAIGPGAPPLIVEVNRPVAEQPQRAETISAARLRHKLSRAAEHEMNLAAKADQHKNTTDAVDHLRRAVELDPDSPETHAALGSRYLRSGDFPAARAELEAAIKLDPDSPGPHTSLALVLIGLNDSDGARDHALLALRRDPLSPAANFAAGVALQQQGKYDRALSYLDPASDTLAPALLVEAEIFLKRSDLSAAAAKIRTYLDRPGIDKRPEVEHWLESINLAQASGPSQ